MMREQLHHPSNHLTLLNRRPNVIDEWHGGAMRGSVCSYTGVFTLCPPENITASAQRGLANGSWIGPISRGLNTKSSLLSSIPQNSTRQNGFESQKTPG